MFDIYAILFQMLVMILLTASLCSGDPCPDEYNGNTSHEIRFESFC